MAQVRCVKASDVMNASLSGILMFPSRILHFAFTEHSVYDCCDIIFTQLSSSSVVVTTALVFPLACATWEMNYLAKNIFFTRTFSFSYDKLNCCLLLCWSVSWRWTTSDACTKANTIRFSPQRRLLCCTICNLNLFYLICVVCHLHWVFVVPNDSYMFFLRFVGRSICHWKKLT